MEVDNYILMNFANKIKFFLQFQEQKVQKREFLLCTNIRVDPVFSIGANYAKNILQDCIRKDCFQVESKFITDH